MGAREFVPWARSEMFSILRNIIVGMFLLTIVVIAIEDLPEIKGGSEGGNSNALAAFRKDAAEAPPNESPSEGGYYGEIEIEMSQHGQYVLEAQVNGEQVDFLVDTGASLVVVDRETAARLGYTPNDLDFTGTATTANGTAPIARIILDEIVIGDLTVSSVEAAVVKTSMPTALLGMSFLSRLEGYEVRDNGLVLRW